MAKRDKAAEFNMIVSLGSQGTAAMFVLAKLMRALRARNVFSDMEILAISDAAAELAAPQDTHDEAAARYAKAVQQAVQDMCQIALGAPSPAQGRH